MNPMHSPIGLTGGPGCGKSAAATCLADAGFDIIDTDALAREAVEPGRRATRAILRDFGARFFDPDGRLRRDDLARLVFADDAARERLNAIVHPVIRAMWKSAARRSAEAGRPCAVVIPLLFESSLEKEFAATVCVGCSPQTQQGRLLARGWDDTMIRMRVAAQLPLEEKCRRATYVIWNDGPIDLLRDQIATLVRLLASDPPKKLGLQNIAT